MNDNYSIVEYCDWKIVKGGCCCCYLHLHYTQLLKKQNKCSNCGGLGHNKKKCKKPPQPTAPKSKGGKPKSIDPVVQNIEKKKKRKRKGTGDQVQTSTLQPPQPSQPSQSSCISTVVLDFASQT